MNSLTDLANYSLSKIGMQTISDIDDTSDQVARVCKQFIQQIIDLTLRSGRWNCATARATLTQLSIQSVTNLITYQLPSDFLRIMEVNGEEWGCPDQFFEIEGQTLVTYSKEATIRYVCRVIVPQMDAALVEAISFHLASVICANITANLQLQVQMWNLYQKALSKAQALSAVEAGSNENPMIFRILDSSALVRSRGVGSLNSRGYLRHFPS